MNSNSTFTSSELSVRTRELNIHVSKVSPLQNKPIAVNSCGKNLTHTESLSVWTITKYGDEYCIIMPSLS